MRTFYRVFKYIWPQWPRLIVIFVSAILISILFSMSFMTIIPLLKVMMGAEGLHGWVDRKVCRWRYGIEFYVPDRNDLTDPQKPDIAYYLLVTRVKDDSPAEKAGLRPQDRIWDLDRPSMLSQESMGAEDQPKKAVSSKLLEQFSTAAANSKITVRYKRFGQDSGDEQQSCILDSGEKKAYLGWIEKVMSFLPRDDASGSNKTRAISLIIIFISVITVFRCIARFYQQYLSSRVTQTAIAGLRVDTFAHAVDLPVEFFETNNPSDAVSRLIRDTNELGKGVHILLGKTLREPLKALALLATAMLLDANLTLIFLCAAPLTVVIVLRLGRKIKRATKKSLMSSSLMLGKLKEAFGSIKVIKVYNRQDYESEKFKAINKGLLKQAFRIAKVEAATNPIMEVLGMFAGGAALLFGAYWVTQRQIDATEFFALVILLGTAAESVRKSSDIWNKIQQANAAAERVFAIVDKHKEKEKADAFELAPLKDRIEFRQIIFTYPGSDRAVLKEINLTVQAGHNVAIVGPNGSGKTTLVNLIPRFHDPDSGQILIDGKDIQNSTLYSLRSQIGMVTQNVVTFNDTIAANIGYGRSGATRDEIITAAKRAFAHEFISPLPNGYDTIIGEQGAGLSGGQLQRIIIARAILKNPAILIFDEATSQVDTESEAKIHKAIEEIMHDRTTFIIAHRFSTVIAADIIVVMDDGQIIARGQHEELMESCSLYQSLYETQLVKA